MPTTRYPAAPGLLSPTVWTDCGPTPCYVQATGPDPVRYVIDTAPPTTPANGTIDDVPAHVLVSDGDVVYGERQKALPTLTPLSGTLSLLSGVISGTNAALALLSGFLPTEPAAGAGFSLIAVKSSRVIT